MCGITGIYNFNNSPVNQQNLHRMTREIIHRGPDDEGFYFDQNVGLGFRRLSILDLSQSGHQPMSNDDRSMWIVFNGEIYNYIELRSELQGMGYEFRSQTDTEVILAAYKAWGAECLNKFNGMWSFALWDAGKKELFCARDRFGVKPFYYFKNAQQFIFASEIKSILTHPDVERTANEKIIYNFLIGHIRDWNEETFFNNIYQLLPGHFLRIKNNEPEIQPFYSLDLNKKADPLLNEEEAIRRFSGLFEDSVRLRLRSDVPVGSCLSGGLDSSAIVCVLNRLLRSNKVSPEQIGERQKTFSAHSELKSVDESVYMDAVLQQTGAERNFILPTDTELTQTLDHFITHLEEPFPSTSLFAQYCVMRLARQRGVIVLLDGQGSDEILGGYDHAFIPYFAGLLRKGRLVKYFMETQKLDRRLSFGTHLTIALHLLPPTLGSSLRKRLLLKVKHGINKKFIRAMGSHRGIELKNVSSLKQKLSYDMKYILRSLLMYEDKNSMAFSIEARVPFLDYRLVEYIFSLPDEYKIRSGLRKYMLRKAMRGIVPDMILDRRDKIGFATAEKQWLADGPLRNKMLEVFESTSFHQRKYFDARLVLEEFRKFPAEPHKKNYINFWGCFNLELWLRKYIDKS